MQRFHSPFFYLYGAYMMILIVRHTFYHLHDVYRRVRRPRRTASNDYHHVIWYGQPLWITHSNDWYKPHRRGEHCSPATRITVADISCKPSAHAKPFTRTRLPVVWANNVRPYGYASAYEFIYGAPRSSHPTVWIVNMVYLFGTNFNRYRRAGCPHLAVCRFICTIYPVGAVIGRPHIVKWARTNRV